MSSLLSRLNHVVKGAGHVVANSFDAARDAVASLDNDDDALSLGDVLAFFKHGTQATRASTPVVLKDRAGRAAATRDTFRALGVNHTLAYEGSFIPAGPGAVTAETTSGLGKVFGPAAHAINKDVLEPIGSHIPNTIRAPGATTTGFAFHSVADPIAEGVKLMNDAYNGVSRGISTVVLASELRADKELQASIKDKPFLEQLGYVNRMAWDAAKETSPGQAIMYAVLGGNHVDITDPDQVGRILDSPMFDYGSGAIDAGIRVFGDPTALALGGLTKAQEAYRVKQAATFASEGATVVGSGAEQAAGVDKLYDAFRSAESPAEVRRRFFPSRNNQAAHIQSTALWDAAHLPDDVPTRLPNAPDAVGAAAQPAEQASLGMPGTAGELNPTPTLEAPRPRRFGGAPRPSEPINLTSPSREKFNVLLRAMLGNEEAAGLLTTADAATRERLALAQQMRNWAHPVIIDPANPLLRVVTPDFVVGNPVQVFGESAALTAAQREQIDALTESLYPQAIRASREADLIGTLAAQGGELPRATLRSAVRTNVVRSEFWQSHPLGRVLRVFADINPQARINLHEADFDVHVDRMLTNIGFDQGSRDAWRTAAMRASGAGERRAILTQLDDAVIDFYSRKFGIDPEVLRDARDAGRNEIDAMFAAAKYDTESETTILRTLNEAGEAEDYHLPLHPTQLENWAGLPDYQQIEKLAKQYGNGFTKRELAVAFGDQLLNPFYRVWKPAVLLGIRTPTRIVGEEAVRFMSTVGAMQATGAISRNVGAKLGDLIGLTDEELRYLPGVARHPVTGPLIEGAASPSLGAEGVRNVYSGALDASAGGVLQYGSMQDKVFEKLADSFKNWKSLAGTDPGHMEAWLNDINKQIRQAPLAKQLLANGGDIQDAIRWLRREPEGQITMRANKLWARDPEGWALSVQDQINRYLPTEELRAAAARGAVTEDMLTAAFPDAAARPNVHGQLLAYTIGEDHVSKSLLGLLDNFHQATAVQPSIQLTRQPMFDLAYRKAIEDQARMAIRAGRQEQWTMEELRQVERNAHRVAIGSVRETLYDMAEYSRFAEATRFIAPFANATREVITTWLGIAMKNPAFVRRIQIAWKAPERAGWVYDGEGNRVNADGTAQSPLGKKVDAAEGRYIRVRFPDWANDIPALGRIVPDNAVMVNKDSLNTILANPYGSSPVIEIAFARLLDNAAIESKLKPFFPYGVERSLYKPLLPSAIRAVTDKQAQAKAAMQMYWSSVAEYEANGRQGPQPKMSDAVKAAGHLSILQALAKLTVPASVRTTTPMQPYIDIYKEMQRTDPEHAQENFLDKYGSEFAALTLSLTKTIDHVQPTLEAWKRRGQLADFIAQYPELGAVAVGEVSDPFNPAVYDKQQRTRVGGENYDRQRRPLTLNEAQQAPGVTAGWYEFSRGMDLIEAERINRKLPNLRVKAAQDLAAAKKAFIAELGAKYPVWQAEYVKDDPSAYDHRIEGMREIVNRLGGKGRSDIDYLGYYLDFRDTVETALSQRAARGRSGQLDSASNKDLLTAWETGVSTLIQKSPAFQRLWNRYLDHDQPRGHRDAA